MAAATRAYVLAQEPAYRDGIGSMDAIQLEDGDGSTVAGNWLGLDTAGQAAQDSNGVTIDFANWPCERVWHVVSGLGSRRSDLLPFVHQRAVAFERTANARPGTIERLRGIHRIHCADGTADVVAAPLSLRIERAARRFFSRAAMRSQST